MTRFVETARIFRPMSWPRAGFTNRLGRLKPWASEKMRGLIKNNKDIFSCFTNRPSRPGMGNIRPFYVFMGHMRTCKPFLLITDIVPYYFDFFPLLL